MKENIVNHNILSTLPIPDLSPLQLSTFNLESLRARVTNQFNPVTAVEILGQHLNKTIVVCDIGGTGIKYTTASVEKNGNIAISPEEEHVFYPKEDKGSNYITVIQEMKNKFEDLPMAISTAGIVENNELKESRNFQRFTEKLRENGGFQGIFGRKIPVMNDAQAGVIAGAYEMFRQKGTKESTIYLINGGGIGGAVLKEKNVISMEPGHIVVSDQTLNPNRVTTACEFYGEKQTCLEKIAASGAGIEAQSKALFARQMSGKEIAQLLYSGDKKAIELYANSGLITAHIIEGIIQATDLQGNISVVLHGGFFKTKGIIKYIDKILQKYNQNKKIELVETQSLGMTNACMTGLAIAALTIIS